MEQKLIKQTLQSKPLKEVFTSIQQRKQYYKYRISQSKMNNPYLLRIEPHSSTSLPKKYITLMVEGSSKMSYVNATLYKKLNLDHKSGLFMYMGKKTVINNHTVQFCAEMDKIKEDKILYLQYTNYQIFG